jgi:predicted lipid-binding transport protein (Tim44 family)
LIAHGRVDARIATRYLMTRFARQRSQSTHERAANAQNMYMHPRILGGCFGALKQGCLAGLTITPI